MLTKTRTMILAGSLGAASLLGAGTREAKAQVLLATPGFSVGVGAPVVGVYPPYGVYPGYRGYPGFVPPVGVYPVRPYPYRFGYPGVYPARPFRPYRPYGYRRW